MSACCHRQQAGDEDTLVREFCRHTHNTQDSCAHKHVRVRTTNKRLKTNSAIKGASSDEEPAVKGDDDGDLSDTPLARKRNREAVRKYRQRKREQTQSLTQEVEQLRADNARLLAELAQHNKLKEELRVLRMVVNSVSSAVNTVPTPGAGGDLVNHTALDLQMGGGGHVMCMLPPQQRQPQQLQMGQQMLGQQLGVDAMMRSFLEMQNQNALFRQMNPAPPSNGGL